MSVQTITYGKKEKNSNQKVNITSNDNTINRFQLNSNDISLYSINSNDIANKYKLISQYIGNISLKSMD